MQGQLLFHWQIPAQNLRIAAIPAEARYFRVLIRGSGLSQPLVKELELSSAPEQSYRLSLPVGPKEVTVLAYNQQKALSRSRTQVEILPSQLTRAEMELTNILREFRLNLEASWPVPLELELEVSGEGIRSNEPWLLSLQLPLGQSQLSVPDFPAESATLRLRSRPQGFSEWGEWVTQALTEQEAPTLLFRSAPLLESWQPFLERWLNAQPEASQLHILRLMGTPLLQQLLNSPVLSADLKARIQAELDRRKNSGQNTGPAQGNGSGPSPVSPASPQASGAAPSAQPSAVQATPSPLVSASPSVLTVPASPAGFRLEEAGDTYLRLAWEAVSGASAYSLSLNGQVLTDSHTFTSFTLNGLSPQTAYHFLLRARNPAGESGSVPLDVQTLATGSRTTGGGSATEPSPTATPWPAPVFESLSPTQVTIGSRLVIRGQNFFAPVRVIFDGGYEAAVVSLTDREIQVEVPSLARQGQIRVTTVGGEFTASVGILLGAIQLDGGYH